MNQEEIKIRSLELAVELKTGSTADANHVVKEAMVFYNFIVDKNDKSEDTSNKSGNRSEVAYDNKQNTPDNVRQAKNVKLTK